MKSNMKMKLMKSKKGYVFIMLVVLFFFFALGMILLSKYRDAAIRQQPKFIGEDQLAIMKTSQDAEKMLLYIDQSAKYAVSQSLIELAENGGYFNNPKCGSYEGYNIWYNGEECYPHDTISGELALYVNKNLEPYLAVYPAIPPNNYDISFFKGKKLQVYGLAYNNMEIGIEKDAAKEPIEETII